MYFKKLIGEKCYLSPIDANDAEKFAEWLNDLEVSINLRPYNEMISLENEKVFINNVSKGHTYSIIDIEQDELIGNCGFSDIDHVNQTGQARIFIGNRKYWNKGYGREALSLLIDYGFKALNLHNIMLVVYEYNKGAKKCYEKVGFKQIGIRREALYRNLRKHNIIYMDILPSEFYEKHKHKIIENLEQ
jgi:RimJ/RimL family protein N-acetyltransferase